MTKVNVGIALLVTLLLMTTLACGLGLKLPEVDNPVSVAATAQVAAQQAGGVVQTVAAEAPEQGGAIVATLQVADSPDLDVLRERFANIDPDQNGNYSVTLTDAELNRVLQLQPTLSDPGSQVQIQDPVVTFTAGEINFNAQILEPLPANLSVTFQPYVSDGQLRFNLQQASLAGLPVPEPLLSVAEGTLNDALIQGMSDVPAGFQLLSVTIGEGALTIVARPA